MTKKKDIVKILHDGIKSKDADWAILFKNPTSDSVILEYYKGFGEDGVLVDSDYIITTTYSELLHILIPYVLTGDYTFMISTENPPIKQNGRYVKWNLFIKAIYRGVEPQLGLNFYKNNTIQFVRDMIHERTVFAKELYEYLSK